MRVLGLDVGDRRIGVALSDPLGLMATPLTTIHRTSELSDIEAVLGLAKEHEAAEIVVGLPISLSGRIGSQARSVQGFVRQISERTKIPVVTVDERYSTFEAERLLEQAGAMPSRDRCRVDAAAAAVILTAHLDRSRVTEGRLTQPQAPE